MTVDLLTASSASAPSDPKVRVRPNCRVHAASHMRLRALADALPQMVWILDGDDGATTYANRRFRDAMGRMGGTYLDWLDTFHPEDRPLFMRGWAEAVDARRLFAIEARLRGANAAYRWHQITIAPLRRGTVVMEWLGTALDIEDAVATNQALRASEERFAFALEISTDGLVDIDMVTDEGHASDRWWRILGYEPGEHRADFQTWQSMLHPEERGHVLRLREAHRAGLTPLLECEHRLRRKDGTWCWVHTRGRIMRRDTSGKPLRYIGTHTDIGARKMAEMELAYQAHHDSLTGLPNRLLFHDRLRQSLAHRSEKGVAVLSCDLDRFKAVNDSLGHAAGDDLLRVIAERMQAVLRVNDLIARIGGDEFAVIVTLDAPDKAAEIACRLTEAVGNPIVLRGRHIEVGLSVGYAEATPDADTAETLFERADIALYEAKAAGRSTFRAFKKEAGARAVTRGQLALDMKEAIRRGEFHLVYQPVIELATGTVASFEALLRWGHPERGEVSPHAFIPIAEETGLIRQLGAFALRQACHEATRWPAGVRVAVNLSALQLQHEGIEREVLMALTDAGLIPGRLKLEVTESVLLQDAETALARLHRFRNMGVRVVLDDFGTGYSSLSYLRRFPFDKIKIDRSFVTDIANPDTAAIVRAVVGIGERLGLGIVAEGVETVEQLDLVRREGCGEVQGFLFSPPLPPERALSFLKAHALKQPLPAQR